MQIIKKVVLVTGVVTLVALPCFAVVSQKSSPVMLNSMMEQMAEDSMPMADSMMMQSDQMMPKAERTQPAKSDMMNPSDMMSPNMMQPEHKPMPSTDMREMSDDMMMPMANNTMPMAESMMQSNQMMPKSPQPMPMAPAMMAAPDMMSPNMQQRPMSSDDMKMMSEGMEQLLRSLVLLIDIDFYKKMIVVDVDFYRDEARLIDSLLMRYAHNPEQAEQMLNDVAQRYMNENGDAVVLSLLKNFKIADPELLTHIVRPLVQKALMGEILKAMHRCIMHKCIKLNELMSR